MSGVSCPVDGVVSPLVVVVSCSLLGILDLQDLLCILEIDDLVLPLLLPGDSGARLVLRLRSEE